LLSRERCRSVRSSCSTRRKRTPARKRGKVGTDGAFRLTTYDADDGAPAGEYTATLLWNKLVKKGQDYAAGPNLVPVEYATRETSPWKLIVDAKPNELLPLDIKK
jgi:hypothetical protein